MGGAASNEEKELRISVEAPWLLWDEVECVIDGMAVTLRDTTSGAEVRLRRWEFVRQTGRVLRFYSRASPVPSHCIEFAGLGRDASYEVICPDESTAAQIAARIENRPTARS